MIAAGLEAAGLVIANAGKETIAGAPTLVVEAGKPTPDEASGVAELD